MLSAAAATSILSLSSPVALAATGPSGQVPDSGLLSGNRVQAPLEVPLTLCGNTVDAAAALNPASGNACDTESGTTGAYEDASEAPAGTTAMSETAHSAGLLSGNDVQVPITAPVNACGDSVDVVGALSGTTGNRCASGSAQEEGPAPGTSVPAPAKTSEQHALTGAVSERSIASTRPAPARASSPTTSSPTASSRTAPELVPERHHHAPKPTRTAAARDQLAETGADSSMLGAAAASAGLVLGGAILYRRGRTAART